MIKKFFDKRMKAKMRFLTFRLHKSIRYTAVVLFALATFLLASFIGGLPTTREMLDAVTHGDLFILIFFAAAMSFIAFALGRMYEFRNRQLVIKGFLLTHTLDMDAVESLERAERWGFTWFRLHCGGRSFMIHPPDDADEFARCVEKGMEGENFEGSYTKYGQSWFI